MNKKRKLVAILFADIQGYTALMQRDEAQASQLLQKFRNTLNEKVAYHSGEIINNYGDGCLCTFESAVDAMTCAKEAQLLFQEAPKVPVRIGLHSGDVFFEDNNVFGDSVNIASRIESLGVAGAVLFSKRVKRDIANQTDFKVQSVGEFDFKNVEKTMEVFGLANEGLVIPNQTEIQGKGQQLVSTYSKGIPQWLKLGGLALALLVVGGLAWNALMVGDTFKVSPTIQTTIDKSIAVLPFTDLSPKQDQGYFSIGMMEEILNHLVKIEGLSVTSRTSVMQYVNTTTPVSVICKELGVANILEGSVRKAGDQVRITVQLIDGKTDKHIWSETYDKKLEDIFGIQSDVAQSIAAVLETEIYPEVKARIEAMPTVNLEAYDLWLKGESYTHVSAEAEQFYLRAIEVDSNFAPAYAELGNVWLTRGALIGEISREEMLPKATYYINKALEKDKNYAATYLYLGELKLWFHRDFAGATNAFNNYIRLNPSSFNGNLVDFFLATEQFEKAQKWAKRINQIDKSVSNGWTKIGLTYSLLKDFETANRWDEEALALFPNYWYLKSEIARSYLYAKDYPKVIELVNGLLADNPPTRFPRALGLLAIAYHQTGQIAQAQTLLAELKEISKKSSTGSPSFYIGMVYAQMNEIDAAFEWLEKSYQDWEVEVYWLKVEPPFEPLHQDERWELLLDKVGFLKNLKG